ncbi:hypothetical protein ACH4GP_36630 [Streptomyces celluloflavus]|uniref:Uncharacterized protein n=1 Tax=Streptomyces celluloflavus TaxID=58344 RepID=A0ABW7RSK4_9ACTN
MAVAVEDCLVEAFGLLKSQSPEEGRGDLLVRGDFPDDVADAGAEVKVDHSVGRVRILGRRGSLTCEMDLDLPDLLCLLGVGLRRLSDEDACLGSLLLIVALSDYPPHELDQRVLMAGLHGERLGKSPACDQLPVGGREVRRRPQPGSGLEMGVSVPVSVGGEPLLAWRAHDVEPVRVFPVHHFGHTLIAVDLPDRLPGDVLAVRADNQDAITCFELVVPLPSVASQRLGVAVHACLPARSVAVRSGRRT